MKKILWFISSVYWQFLAIAFNSFCFLNMPVWYAMSIHFFFLCMHLYNVLLYFNEGFTYSETERQRTTRLAFHEIKRGVAINHYAWLKSQHDFLASAVALSNLIALQKRLTNEKHK